MHVCVRTSVCACVMGGQQKPFDPKSNTGSSLNLIA